MKKILTSLNTGVKKSRVDSVWLSCGLIPIDRKVNRKSWRVTVAKVWIDALGQVFGVRPSAFQPNAVAPHVRVVHRFYALGYQLFRVARRSNDKT